MRVLFKLTALLAFLVVCVCIFGCTGSPQDPPIPDQVTNEEGYVGEAASDRILWGIWAMRFDTDEMIVFFEPLRYSQTHFDITNSLRPPACDDCIKSTLNSFDPVSRVMDIDITLRNPFPIYGFDVRGILHKNEYGHKLLNADDLTGLFDVPGGMPINPFKAFAKGEPQRVFEAGAEHTEKYLVYIPDPPNNDKVTFAVDASWPDNCEEPYKIAYFVQEGIFDTTGSSGKIYISVYDWQDDVNKVTLSAPEITGEQFTQFNHWNGDTWCLELVNNQGVPAGDYRVLIIAASTGSGGLELFDIVTIHISPEPGDPHSPVDVTPPELMNLTLYDVAIYNGYAHVVAKENYLADRKYYTVNIQPPESAYIAAEDSSMSFGDEIKVANDIAYICGPGSGIHMYDISQPVDPNFIKTAPTSWNVHSFDVQNGYAFVAYNIWTPPGYSETYFDVVDVDPPAEAHIAKTIVLSQDAYATPALATAVSGDFAFVAMGELGVWVIRVNPPESPYIYKKIKEITVARDIVVADGYAYIVTESTGLYIVDIDPIYSIDVVNHIDTPGKAKCVAVSGGYAYVADGNAGVQIIDIDPVDTAYILSSIELDGYSSCIAVYDGYAYVGGGSWGVDFRIFKLW